VVVAGHSDYSSVIVLYCVHWVCLAGSPRQAQGTHVYMSVDGYVITDLFAYVFYST
jgi:hypothetical protein